MMDVVAKVCISFWLACVVFVFLVETAAENAIGIPAWLFVLVHVCASVAVLWHVWGAKQDA